MNKYDFEGNSYFIFDKDTASGMVYFLWGKFDFRLYFRKTDEKEATAKKKISFQGENGTYFVADKLQHQRHGIWYDYQKVTSHGFTFQETQWSHEGKTYYAEFPKEFFVVAAHISAQELNLKAMQ